MLQLHQGGGHLLHLHQGRGLAYPLHLHQEMLQKSLTPDIVSHRAAISACGKGKPWQGAIRLLQEMLQRSLVSLFAGDAAETA